MTLMTITTTFAGASFSILRAARQRSLSKNLKPSEKIGDGWIIFAIAMASLIITAIIMASLSYIETISYYINNIPQYAIAILLIIFIAIEYSLRLLSRQNTSINFALLLDVFSVAAFAVVGLLWPILWPNGGFAPPYHLLFPIVITINILFQCVFFIWNLVVAIEHIVSAQLVRQ